jgi:hypothetical protein
MTRISWREFLKLTGARAIALTFWRLFHQAHVTSNLVADVYLGTDNGSTIKHLLQVDPNAMCGN